MLKFMPVRAIADHPRIRGEHIEAPPFRAPPMGSSPHTRGAPLLAGPDDRDVGIIPAYAGSTLRGASRVGGAVGSSPHTRGARAHRGPQMSANGIIPAYAGSTALPFESRHGEQDHPRIRGEHYPNACSGTLRLGSSPHTRGARWVTGWRTPG